MRSVPQEFFIKYLCSIPGMTVGKVRDYCAKMGIGIWPSDHYLADVFEEVTRKLPRNYYPRDPSHELTHAFLREMRIHSMWFPSRATNEAVSLFKNNRVAGIVNALVIQDRKPEEIVDVLDHFKGVSITAQAVPEYRHYFMNIDLLTMEELAEYLDRAPVKTVASVALHAPRNLDGVRLVLYKVGHMPKSMDKEHVLATMRDVGFMNFLEADGLPQGTKKALLLSSYGNVVIRSQEKLDEIAGKDLDVISQFYRHVQLKGRETEHKTLAELQAEDAVAEPQNCVA